MTSDNSPSISDRSLLTFSPPHPQHTWASPILGSLAVQCIPSDCFDEADHMLLSFESNLSTLIMYICSSVTRKAGKVYKKSIFPGRRMTLTTSGFTRNIKPVSNEWMKIKFVPRTIPRITGFTVQGYSSRENRARKTPDNTHAHNGCTGRLFCPRLARARVNPRNTNSIRLAIRIIFSFLIMFWCEPTKLYYV